MKSLALALGLAVFACNATTAPELQRPVSESSADSLIVIFNTHVIPMDRERVLEQHSIVIRAGRIAEVVPAAQLPALRGAQVIDGRGKYVMPGLIDMHVHMDRADLGAYLAHGITSVRNMWGYTQLAALIADVEAGRVRGPSIYSLSSGFDGSPAKWPQTQLVDDLAQIAPLFNRQADQGYREIKVYTDLSRAAYDSIIAMARARGMTFAGHVPRRVGLSYALQQRQRSIEHLGGYSLGDITAQARATQQAGSWNCPTLAIQNRLQTVGSGDHLRMVKALHDAGARLLVGTDAGIGVTEPGRSMADELSMFVQAGLSPYEALRGATSSAAEYLRRADEIGTIKAGARADLLLLDANPLRDVLAVRRIHRLLLRGVPQ